MEPNIFDNSFDIEQYMEKRVLEVKNIEERRLLKNTFSHLFIDLYYHIEEEYRNLEEKIFNEMESDVKKFSISTSIIPRDKYDETDEIMVPMMDQDKQEREVDILELTNSLKKGKAFFIYTILIKADYLLIKEMEKQERKYAGVVKTPEGEYRAIFSIKKNQEYLKMIEQLYQIFQINYLPWNTVCSPFLNKLYDVSIESIEGWKKDSKILGVCVDFEEFDEYIAYNCIPVWNITISTEKTSSYPEACIDKINYQHTIFSHRLDLEANYLVGNLDTPIKNIRRIDGDLVITCKVQDPMKWILYKLEKKQMKKNSYPIMSNAMKNDFTNALNYHFGNQIKTKKELERFIISLNYNHILLFTDAQIVEVYNKKPESYNMDFFIEDELRTVSHGWTLILYFHAVQSGYYLNRDIMSYIVTQVQKLYSEYYCIGELL